MFMYVKTKMRITYISQDLVAHTVMKPVKHHPENRNLDGKELS